MRPKHYQPKTASIRPADYQPAHRTCLGVGCADKPPEKRFFWSLGPGIRLCPRCAKGQDDRRRALSKMASGPAADARV